MQYGHEWRWPGIVAGYTVLLAMLGALTSLAYDIAAPEYRPRVIRLAVVAALGVALVHVLVRWRRSEVPPSRFDAALARRRSAPGVASAFRRARDRVAHGRRSRDGFERLRAILSDTRDDPGEVPWPTYRRWLRLGPARQAIADVIADAEQARAERR